MIVRKGMGDNTFPKLTGKVKLIDGAIPPSVVAGVGISVLRSSLEFIRPKNIRIIPRANAKELLKDLGINSSPRFFLKKKVIIVNKTAPINADTRTYSSW